MITTPELQFRPTMILGSGSKLMFTALTIFRKYSGYASALAHSVSTLGTTMDRELWGLRPPFRTWTAI